MKIGTPRTASLLLAASALLLTAMVPGGPLEARSFAGIAPAVLVAFNTFLTSLGLASFGIAYGVWRQRRWAMGAAAVCGALYFCVYALDLGGVFPVSANAMPRALLAAELLGTALSLPLTACALRLHQTMAPSARLTRASGPKPRLPLALGIIALGILAAGIIAFATRAAMR
ncbi:MAG: hypothetical protein AUJ49_11310 [Desulfovibrionaceae bacterium CG1_02_65_16]|nr:MAG: hypothetical protein AUJ49_11310 [Desulfovibrionaceae bacterium CG1_02_65_16]